MASEKHVVVVVGTRPEAIKMAPVVHALRAHPRAPRVSLCVTGQHRELLDQVLRVFDLAPAVDLRLMRPDQRLDELTAAVLQGVGQVLAEHPADWVLVHGDTTTAFGAALAAYYVRCPIGHVEAGLRTYNKYAPYPEEMNRRLADVLCDVHYAPTERARENLLQEAIAAENVVVTGNTGVDALLLAAARDAAAPVCLNGLDGKRLVLVTAHRRENFGPPLAGICQGIRQLAAAHPDLHFVYPVHPNPHVRETVDARLGGLDQVRLVAPLAYLPFVQVIKRCTLVLTDSGGLQEEAPSLGKPVLVLRDVTERPEAVEAGVAQLVGTDPEAIFFHANMLLTNSDVYKRMSHAVNPYGDGHAAERIAEDLVKRMGE